MKTQRFQDITIASPGFGTMSFHHYGSPTPDDQAFEVLQKAVDLGCTFWDTAVMYGKGENERIIGDFLKARPGVREKLFIASKCGFDCLDGHDGHLTNKREHILEYIEGTIKRLGSAPDMYYIHRIDPDTPLEESIGTMDELRKAGKFKYIGLSECGAETLEKACKIAKIDAIQIEYSAWFTDHDDNGLIATARRNNVEIIAYSPLGKGILTGTIRSVDDFESNEADVRKSIPRFQRDVFDKNMKIVHEFEWLAKKKGCTPSQLAIAWCSAMDTIPIPGTKSVSRLEENFGAKDVDLTKEELEELNKLCRDAKPEGARYNEAALKMIGR